MADEVYVYEYDFKLSCHRYSLVVFGKEYAYGSKGVKIREQGAYGKSLPIEKTFKGRTDYSKQAFERFIERPEFKGSNYNVMTHNCLTFVNMALEFLTDNGVLHEGGVVSFNPIAIAVNCIAWLCNMTC